MKKPLPLLLCAALLLTLPACAAKQEQPENPYRTKSILNEYLDNSGNTASTQRYDMTYNNEGLLVKQTTTTDGVRTETLTFMHDEYGNVTQSVRTADGTAQVTEYQLTLDDVHRPIRIETYQGEKLLTEEEFTYDKDGNEILNTTTSWENGNTRDVYTNEYTYDRHGNLTERIWTRGNSIYYSTYANGKLMKRLHTDKNGQTQDSLQYEYDEQGREVKNTYYDADGQVILYNLTTYNTSGLTATIHTYQDGVLSENRDIFTYDEYGNTLLHDMQWKVDGKWQSYWCITYTYEPIPTTKEATS